MENLTFVGTDASNEISLLEYSLLVSNEPHEDGSGSHFCVYKIAEDTYGCGHIYPNDIDNILKGEDWASNEDIQGFLSFVGEDGNLSGYLESSLIHKISDLMQYFGTENIFGTDYSPMNEDEVKERYLNNSEAV